MTTDNPLQTLQSLAQRKTNATISIAADLANDNLNSICRFALSWISNGKVQGLSYLIKPPTDEFTFRKVTPDMVADRPSFADIWDSEISALLHESLLSAYHSEHLFLAIKASYEASGRPFVMEDVYIRDLQFLAVTYLADLGNSSFTSIMHYMKIPVDLDDALSRAMGCACGLNWLERLFPVSSYGIPLSSIMAGALRPPSPEEQKAAREAEDKKYSRLVHYTKVCFIPFVILCTLLTGYYLHRYNEIQRTEVDFSAYSATEMPSHDTEAAKLPDLDTTKPYIMLRGTYILPNKEHIPDFLQAVKAQDVGKIRTMVRADKVIVFAGPTQIQITGPTEPNGFVPVKVLNGDYADTTGYAPYTMISQQ